MRGGWKAIIVDRLLRTVKRKFRNNSISFSGPHLDPFEEDALLLSSFATEPSVTGHSTRLVSLSHGCHMSPIWTSTHHPDPSKNTKCRRFTQPLISIHPTCIDVHTPHRPKHDVKRVRFLRQVVSSVVFYLAPKGWSLTDSYEQWKNVLCHSKAAASMEVVHHVALTTLVQYFSCLLLLIQYE